MVEMATSYLDNAIENAPLVRSDHLADRTAESRDPDGPPPQYENIVAVLQGEAIPTIQTEEEQRRVTAAGIGSGIFGFLLGGPIVGLVLGFGAAYAAEKKEGALGDTARAVGDVSLGIKSKAKEIDAKHHVVDKSKVVANNAWERAKQVDREHKVLEKTRYFAVYSWQATVDFVRRHNLIERGVNGIGKGVCWLIEKVSGGSGSDRPSDGPEASAPPSRYDAKH